MVNNCKIYSWSYNNTLDYLVTEVDTSEQRNLTKTPHRSRTWTVQSYSPGGANVMHIHLIMLHLTHSQTASRSLQPFLHGSPQRLLILYNGLIVTDSPRQTDRPRYSFCNNRRNLRRHSTAIYGLIKTKPRNIQKQSEVRGDGSGLT